MIQRVRNWKEYNIALKKRGNLVFSFTEEYLEKLYYRGKQKRGGIRKYSEEMYEYLLSIKVLFRLGWRETIGFAEGILKKVEPERQLRLPDYAHAARESGKLKLKVKRYSEKEIGKEMEIAFDSTGVNVYTRSGWHQRKYGQEARHRKHEQWKKIHVVMELNSMEIVGISYTGSQVNDCERIEALSEQIKGKVRSVRADSAYDTEKMYKQGHEWGARVLIPPSRRAKMQEELKKSPKEKKVHLEQRDAIIREIRRYETFEEGLKAWKEGSQYHRRSLVESCMNRIKRRFGFYLQQRSEQGRVNEVISKANLLNLMASFGRAEYSG